MPSFSSSKGEPEPGPAPPPYFETIGALPHQVSVTLPPYNPDDFAYVLPPRLVIEQPVCRLPPVLEPVRMKKRTIICRLLCSLTCVLLLLIVPFLIYVILVDLHVSSNETRIMGRARM
uniref:G_PROTEIN_RECEP_F1_2 domain-containing protein n=1 Tax=Steinernema glaseri TaxID=37863 RepID=A0A1I7ZQW9_9BILA